ncbi:MAG TPA: response regulator [Rhizomicrobium sp.]
MAEPAGKGLRRKALVVEDEALIRMSVCDMLAEIGVESIETANGLDGLTMLADDPSINLLIADLGLPDVSGEDFVRQARDLRPRLKIIVSTGHSTMRALPAFAGVSFLAKPFDLSGLRRVVEAV